MDGDNYRVKSPVAVVVFNRPQKTRTLFNALRLVEPRNLYIIADGARTPDEELLCKEVRLIFDEITWECNVTKIFSDVNLGCAKRLPSGLDEVFRIEEFCIILEDDCIPNVDFFRFCDILLEMYKCDDRISQICGNNPLGKFDTGEYSYSYSKWGPIWGWATWRRSWKYYDIEIKKWKNDRIRNLLKRLLPNYVYRVRSRQYDEHCCNIENIGTWDYQWTFCRLINHQLSIVPCVNLIKNIGEGNDSTHTVFVDSDSQKSYNMKFPLNHPDFIIDDIRLDTGIEKKNHMMPIIEYIPFKLKRIPRRLKRMIH